MKTALLLVDIQRDYFAGGAQPLEGAVEAAAQARILLAHFRYDHHPVVFVQHVSLSREGTSFQMGSPGICLCSTIRPLPGEAIIQKHHANSFRDTGLLDLLHRYEVSRLVVCGMMTHMCVDATVRAGVDLGFECLVASDACATHDLIFEGVTVPAASVQRAFLAALSDTGATVTTTGDIITALPRWSENAAGDVNDAGPTGI